MTRFVVGVIAVAIATATAIPQAQALNTITFGGMSSSCGGGVLCSKNGTHGYLNDGSGRAFKASTIRRWFQINVDGKSRLKGQPAEPVGNAGSFLVRNDTGRPITLFALSLADDFNSRTVPARPCTGARSGKACTSFSSESGTGAYKFKSQLSGSDWDKCTTGKARRRLCAGNPATADFAPDRVTSSWRARRGGAIANGAYFTISFSGWNNNAWASPPSPPSLLMLSQATDGTPGNAYSSVAGFQTFTADSNSIVFSTVATNLPGSSDSTMTLYVYDRSAASLAPISTTLPSSVDRHGAVWQSISADGGVIGYAGGDAGGDYIYDVASQTTKILGGPSSPSATISGNGQYLVYSNNNSPENVWVYDRAADTTKQMLAPDGNPPDNDGCEADAVSGSGQIVTFKCDSDNMVAGVSGEVAYVWDQFANTFDIATRSTEGGEGIPVNGANISISPGGRYIILDSDATNLVPGGTSGHQVFLYDSVTKATQLVSSASDGTQADGYQLTAGISPDGRFALFYSTATNLVGGVNNGINQVYLKDLQTGDIQAVSVASDGTAGNSESTLGAISPDEQYVVFQSQATNLVEGGSGATQQVYLATLQ